MRAVSYHIPNSSSFDLHHPSDEDHHHNPEGAAGHFLVVPDRPHPNNIITNGHDVTVTFPGRIDMETRVVETDRTADEVHEDTFVTAIADTDCSHDSDIWASITIASGDGNGVVKMSSVDSWSITPTIEDGTTGL